MHIVATDIAAAAADADRQLQELPPKLRACTAASARVFRGSVREALSAAVAQPDAEDAFFVADLGEVQRQFAQWTQLLPRIQPFFAIKCNPDPLVVKLLARLGAGFDCASKAELQQVLREGVAPSNIIYAHPCKPASHVRFARASGVEMMTFDNADELVKMQQLYPGAKAVLRILTDDSGALCKLGLKFGAAPESTLELLRTAQRLGVDVAGVSFHVGSGLQDESAFGDAVLRARRVFDEAESLGMRMTLLDVGGGFPGRYDHSGLVFSDVASELSTALDRYFPASSYAHVRVISEPGRYFVASAFSLAVNIVARRCVNGADGPAFMYYVNDGVYGSFNCIMFDHQHPMPRVLTCNGKFVDAPAKSAAAAAAGFESSVWGPTCDSADCIVPSDRLPELQVGDWLIFDTMGAYTTSAASRFNGFKISDVVYIDTEHALL
ncbi:Ornithine decarboxylase [Coemansia sp. RSA 2598]|nr:Ornithine decarboxylase [Coemansia sp. RSA 2598]